VPEVIVVTLTEAVNQPFTQ